MSSGPPSAVRRWARLNLRGTIFALLAGLALWSAQLYGPQSTIKPLAERTFCRDGRVIVDTEVHNAVKAADEDIITTVHCVKGAYYEDITWATMLLAMTLSLIIALGLYYLGLRLMALRPRSRWRSRSRAVHAAH